jgi:hypothetical protein
LASINLSPAARFAALWRDGPLARVRPLSRPAGDFLASLLQDHSADEALALALGGGPKDTVLAALQAEVFAAPFAQIIPTPQDQTR